MALRGRVVVALVERRGGVLYGRGVCCMHHNAGTAAHISPDCQSTLPRCYGVESSGTWQVHIGTFLTPGARGQFWSDGGRCGWVRDLLG